MAKKTKAETNGDHKVGDFTDTTVLLSDIIANDGQSRGMGVLSHLKQLGYGMFEKTEVDKPPIWPGLMSEDEEEKKAALSLIEKNEHTIVELADSMRSTQQLQPVGVREVKGGYDVIFGMRRCLATAYNHAKYGEPAEIQARVYDKDFSDVDLLLLALEENDNRQDESPIDKALTYQRLKREAKMSEDAIAAHRGRSKQHVKMLLKLLDPKLEDKRFVIHAGVMSVDKALKLLEKRKKDPDAEPTREENDEKETKHRLPSVKTLLKLYDLGKKPKKMEQEEWDLFIKEDVRKYMAHKLGLTYTPFVEDTTPEPEPPAKVLKVRHEKAALLMIALGKMDARTWSNEVLSEKLSNIHEVCSEETSVAEESDVLQKLLDRCRQAYKEGMKIEVSKDGGKKPAAKGKSKATGKGKGKAGKVRKPVAVSDDD